MSKYCITFGGGGKHYIEAGERLIGQAKQLNLFDNVILYTDNYLKNDSAFWEKHGKFIQGHRRGYGYWIWKPYIIQKTMGQMKDGDILLYLDCGNELAVKESAYMEEFFTMVKSYSILGSPVLIERDWTKMDLIIKLDANHDKYLNTPQLQSGQLFFNVCDKTRKLVNDWYSIMCDYHMIDDTKSICKNLECFIQHRHDQSVLSLLTKKAELFNSINVKGKCIKILRNRSGKSRL